MFSPYLFIASMLISLAAFVGGLKVGIDHERAGQISTKDLVAEAVDAASSAAAEAISQIKVKNMTITNEVQHDVQTHTVYADCHLTPSGMQLANQALDPSRAYSLGDGKLPKVDAPK